MFQVLSIFHLQPSSQHLLVKDWQAAQGRGTNRREFKYSVDWFGKERAAKEVPKKALPRMVTTDKEALYPHHPE